MKRDGEQQEKRRRSVRGIHRSITQHWKQSITWQLIWSSPTHEETQSHRDAHTGSGRLTRPPAHWGTTMRRKSCERVKDAYSIPHPVPPKITPRARMVPATAPISLLVATLTVQREKEHYYHPVKNKKRNLLLQSHGWSNSHPSHYGHSSRYEAEIWVGISVQNQSKQL